MLFVLIGVGTMVHIRDMQIAVGMKDQHLTSAHSWVGLIATILLTCQWIVGIVAHRLKHRFPFRQVSGGGLRPLILSPKKWYSRTPRPVSALHTLSDLIIVDQSFIPPPGRLMPVWPVSRAPHRSSTRRSTRCLGTCRT